MNIKAGNRILREYAEIIFEAYKNDDIDGLCKRNECDNFGELFSFFIDCSADELRERTDKNRVAINEAVKEAKRTGVKFVKPVVETISYVPMPHLEITSFSQFLVLYMSGNSNVAGAKNNITNLNYFFRKYLGINLPKTRDSLRRTLSKHGIMPTITSPLFCKIVWNELSKTMNMIFNVEEYNAYAESLMNMEEDEEDWVF